jgi:NAD(P)-dependent dehydrogenase (short-subunit alcohol dehydrogenase family)
MTEFDWQSTTDDVLDGRDLTGKRALVTGVSAGLGIETARALVAKGMRVIGAARDLAKARAATDGIEPAIDLVELDLASLDSVRACADLLQNKYEALDLIVANAGIMATPEGRTDDGFELQLGTNHLGHFVLINRLAPLLVSGARVVILSSSAHQFSDVDYDDPNYETRSYDTFRAYGASKTAATLFAVEFDRRHRNRGVRAAAVHPGMIVTELMRHMDPKAIEQMTAMAVAEAGDEPPAMNLKTVPQGAATSLWAGITSPAELVGGRYCEDCRVAETSAAGLSGVRSYAVDPERAKRLWALSEQLVAEEFV